MKQKYEKPVARDLGDSLSGVEGLCYSGSTATGAPGAHCFPGGSASGAFCSEGQVPTIVACSTGGVPTAHGCLQGIGATISCVAGVGYVG
jgi:hypothetical protein